MSKKPLIISTDPGIDDIAAMTISLFAAELDVKMIVPTWGNVSLAHTLQNTLDLENFLHTKVPVVKGANQPLVRPAISAASVHGETGMAGFEFEKANDDLEWIKLKAKEDIEYRGIKQANATTYLGAVKQQIDLNGITIKEAKEDIDNVIKFEIVGARNES